MTGKHTKAERNLDVRGLSPGWEEGKPLPPQPKFDLKSANGGRASYPKSVQEMLPAGKELTLNHALSTDFMSKRLTRKQKFRNWAFNLTWHGRYPGVFRRKNCEISDTSLLMKAVRKNGPMPLTLSHRFPRKARQGKNKGVDLPYYYEGGFLRTKQSMTFGYTEICCKLSSSAVTSSFWLKELGGTNREIDIFEYTGGKLGNPRVPLGQVHRISVHQFKSRVTQKHEKLSSVIKFDKDLCKENCFIAGLLWTETMLYFFINDVCVRELEHNSLFDMNCKMHIQVDREVFDWVERPDHKDAMDDFEVYYIKTWDLE